MGEDKTGGLPRWQAWAFVGLGLLQWVAFGLDIAIPDIVVFSYLALPVVVSATMGRPLWTGLLAGQALMLGVVSAVVNDYFQDPDGWARSGLLLAATLIGWMLAALVGRANAQRDAALDDMRDSELRYRLLTSETSDVVVEVAPRGVILWASPAAERVMGWKSGDLVGKTVIDLVHPEDRTALVADLADPGALRGRTRSVRRVRCGDGEYRWMEAQGDPLPGTEGHRVLRLRDVDQQVETIRDLEEKAGTDPLTGLHNRREALLRLEALTSKRRTGVHTAVLFVDVDRLKEINDTYGHVAGDALLTALAARILDEVRSTDIAARMGGDEFLVALAGVNTLSEAVAVAEKIRRACAEPVDLDHGDRVCTTISVGVALQVNSEDSGDLMRRADRALYLAKAEGRDRVASDPR